MTKACSPQYVRHTTFNFIPSSSTCLRIIKALYVGNVITQININKSIRSAGPEEATDPQQHTATCQVQHLWSAPHLQNCAGALSNCVTVLVEHILFKTVLPERQVRRPRPRPLHQLLGTPPHALHHWLCQLLLSLHRQRRL